jgi:mRNA-degrading endonuclease RelE of RelBE toxin-antitoxin system
VLFYKNRFFNSVRTTAGKPYQTDHFSLDSLPGNGTLLAMTWDGKLTKKTAKQIRKLPDDIKTRLHFLVQEISQLGPVRNNRLNYGKIRGTKDRHHCHLIKGAPTYVAVWRVIDKENRLVEVVYAGTHEKAFYGRFR